MLPTHDAYRAFWDALLNYDACVTVRPAADAASETPLTEAPLTANAGPAAQGWDEMFRQDFEASLARNGKQQPRGQPPAQAAPTTNADPDMLPPVTAAAYGW